MQTSISVIPTLGLIFLLMIGGLAGFGVALMYRRRFQSGRALQEATPKTPYLGDLSWLAALLMVVGTFAGMSGFDIGWPIVVVAVALMFRGQFLAKRAPQEATPKTPYLAELSWLAAPLVVVGTFAGISGFDDITASRDPVVPKPVAVPNRVVGVGAIVPVPTDDRTTVVSDTKLAQRPAWVDQRSVSDGVVERIVLGSEQYTTQQEAEQQLSVNATELLLDDLQKLRPGTAQPAKWHPADADIRRVMIKNRYVEAIDRDFGNFFHPMYRVWWQVELSPEVRTEFLPGWRHSQTVTRVRWVGIASSSAVLLVSLLAAYRRLDVLTRSTRRPMLIGMSGSVIGLWLLGIRFVAERWL